MTRAVMFEVSATQRGITHHLLIPRPAVSVVLTALRAALPGVVAAVDKDYQPVTPTRAVELALSSLRRPLRLDPPAAVPPRLLASLQPLRAGERNVIQWSAAPLGPVSLTPDPGVLALMWDGFANHPDAEDLRAARAKQVSPLFWGVGRVAVAATTAGRVGQLLHRAESVIRAASGPGAHFYRRRLPQRLVKQALERHELPLLKTPCVFNTAELGALAAIPIGNLALPGLQLGGCRQLAPAPDIPAGGRIVARATFPGAERPLALGVSDSLRHLRVVGPTGSGKST